MEWLLALVSGIPVGWRVFFLSMLPVTELRAALPLGVLWGLSVQKAFLWSVCGNFLPVTPLLLVLRFVYRFLLSNGYFPGLLHKLQSYQNKKCHEVRRYGMIGLTLLVAVPLPGTGIWTGVLAAAVLGLDILPAVCAITLGMLIAGVLVGIAVSGISAVLTLGPEALLFFGVGVAVILVLLRKKIFS